MLGKGHCFSSVKSSWARSSSPRSTEPQTGPAAEPAPDLGGGHALRHSPVPRALLAMFPQYSDSPPTKLSLLEGILMGGVASSRESSRSPKPQAQAEATDTRSHWRPFLNDRDTVHKQSGLRAPAPHSTQGDEINAASLGHITGHSSRPLCQTLFPLP